MECNCEKSNTRVVSIILPAYNARNTIADCLASIVGQTYPNWEAIVIDDGSTDGSFEIIAKLAERDARIKPHHQENRGVSAARNTGLGHVRGEYIVFVDADDYLEKEFLRQMLSEMSETDFAMCAHFVHYPDPKCNVQVCAKCNGVALAGKQPISYSALKAITPAPWGKMYKTSIVQKNHILFADGMKVGEDTKFIYDYLIHAESVSFVPECLYQYRAGNGAWTRFENGKMDCRDYMALLDIPSQAMQQIKKAPAQFKNSWWQEMYRQHIKQIKLICCCKIPLAIKIAFILKTLPIVLSIVIHISPIVLFEMTTSEFLHRIHASMFRKTK